MQKLQTMIAIALFGLTVQAHAADWVEGTVKNVDTQQQRIKIKHGPLTNLHMGAMTMSFAVSNPEMLNQVKKDSEIEFQAENINGTLTVTQLKVK